MEMSRNGVVHMRTVIIGTRQSALALTQTEHTVALLEEKAREQGIAVQFEIKKIVTKGDRILDVTLNKVGGKGLFVKEIEQAMLSGEIDMAVHSMKDMPWQLPPGLMNAAVPKREDPRDVLISRSGEGFKQLPSGACIGTSSLRRSAQLQHARRDLEIKWIRGNIDSRIKKMEAGEYDAIILAAAGLRRMGWEDRATEYLPTDLCIPAVGQGALSIQCRENDQELSEWLGLINDPKTAFAVEAERSFLGTLQGGCQVPIGAYAVLQGNPDQLSEDTVVELAGMVGSPDGSELLVEQNAGRDPKQVGVELAERLKDQGAERILAELRG